jgi:pyruvate,water dikinase
MLEKETYAKWFEDLRKDDIPIVGGKNANLGEMLSFGVPVPPGFAITAQAYKKFIEATGVADKIYSILAKIDPKDPKQGQDASKKVRSLVESAPVPDDLKNAISEAYEKLSKKVGITAVSVAVRSSATAEDLPDASFAGQQETYLNVKGVEDLVEKVRKCWSSLFTPRAIFYRVEKGFKHETVLISVAVQKMVNARAAGVLFTIHPATGETDKIVIEANWGLGESVVSGAITPDRYTVDKKTLEIIERQVATKEVEYIRDPKTGKTVHAKVPPDRRDASCLSDKEVKKLAELGKSIEQHYGGAQDVEFSIDRDETYPQNIYIVQSRAETVWSLRARERVGLKYTTEHRLVTKGLPASPGVGAGVAKVTMSTAEASKLMERGNILVTELTNPDWVPYMKLASAIVTDSGGLTCFSGDARILTNEGFMTLAEVHDAINNGEKLLALSFNLEAMKTEWKKILRGTKRRAKLLRITVSQTGRARENTLDVTPDHEMLFLQKRDLGYEKVEKILQNSGMLCVANRIPAPVLDLDPADDLGYLAGAIFSDGGYSFSGTHGQVVFIQKPTSEKEEFINTVREKFEKVFDYELHVHKKSPSSGFIRGKKVIGEATAYLCSRKDIATKFRELHDDLPRWCLNADEGTLKQFIAGLADGDGSLSKEFPRIHIYCEDDKVLEGLVISCLRLGILPQITRNRNCYNVQIVEGISDLLKQTKRLKETLPAKEKVLGTKLLSAKQLLEDVVDQVNYLGRIKPYVQKNLLIDARKLRKFVMPLANEELREKLRKIVESDLKMQRVKKIADLGEDDVYNIEVEGNHNYIVFTKFLTPVIVKNCHAAIVSREMGIPCIVGARNATEVMKTGSEYTVDAEAGYVYDGIIEEVLAKKKEAGIPKPEEIPKTKTRVYVNLSIPELADKVHAETLADGVGLLRAEHMLLGIGKHPRLLIEEGGEQLMVDKFAEGIAQVAKAFQPGPVVYRFLDFKPDEFLNIPGGEKYEREAGHVGPNPLIGYRGAFRYSKEPDVFRLECRAIKKVREELGLKNVWVMVPFVRTIKEFREAKKIMDEEGLKRGPDFKHWIMCEVPSTVLLIDKFVDEGVDGISFGTNDLTMLILGIDRDDAAIQEIYDERNLAVLRAMSHVIRICKKRRVTTSICGQAPSNYPEIVEFLLGEGATSLSVNPDKVIETRLLVAKIEKKLKKQKSGAKPIFKPEWPKKR